MYQVSLFNAGVETITHYPLPDSTIPHLLKAQLSEKAGATNSFNFTITINNAGYNQIFDLITKIVITDISKDEMIFEGRIYNSIENMSSSGEFYKDVVCESELAYLNDSITRIWTIENMSVADFVTKIIQNHNEQTLEDMHFTAGNINVEGTINCTTEYENSLNCLINKVINVLGKGYLVVRKENGVRYLDYLTAFSGTSDDIIIAKNMKDLQFTKDVTNIATRIIPIGKDSLTVASVNDGLDYIDSTEGINSYGIITQVVKLDTIEDPTELLAKGQETLANMIKPIFKLATNTLDLSLLGIDHNGFNVGTDTNISCSVINFAETFNIIQKDTDLLSPQNCKITLNDKIGTLTSRQLAMQRAASAVNKILTSDNQVNTFYLSGYIDLLKNNMKAMADTAEKQNTKCILFEDKQEGSSTFGAMALGTKGFMIADTIVNSDWDWKTFGTGKGFVADLIVAGKILGGCVEFNLDEGYLKINHNDSSYTQMDSDGLNHFNGTTKKEYHYMTDTGSGNAIGSGTTGSFDVTITLDESYKNKDFKVIVPLTGYEITQPGWQVRLLKVWSVIEDTVNGTFTFSIGGILVNSSGQESADMSLLHVSYAWMVIA